MSVLRIPLGILLLFVSVAHCSLRMPATDALSERRNAGLAAVTHRSRGFSLPMVYDLSHIEAAEHVNVPLSLRDLHRLCSSPCLEVLRLQCCSVCSRGCKIIAGSPRLQELQLVAAGLSDASVSELAPLSELHVLDLRGNPITDEGLAVLASLRKLQWLDLRGTRVTPGGIVDLQAGRPRLKILWDNANTAGAIPRQAEGP